jgi:predicted transporter
VPAVRRVVVVVPGDAPAAHVIHSPRAGKVAIMGPAGTFALAREIAAVAAGTAALVGFVLIPRFAAFAARWHVDATRWAALLVLPVVAPLAAVALCVVLLADGTGLDAAASAGLAAVCVVILVLVVRQVRADDHGVLEHGQHERVPLPR